MTANASYYLFMGCVSNILQYIVEHQSDEYLKWSTAKRDVHLVTIDYAAF